jgi:hypothetical protein
VVVAAPFLLARRRFRLGALAVLSAFTVLQALSDVAVFRHAVVVSALPASLVRATVSISLGCGLALALLAYRGLEPDGSTPYAILRPPRRER